MKTNYITISIIVILLIILFNIFINIDKKIFEEGGRNTQSQIVECFSCDNLMTSDQISFSDLPTKIVNYDNSLVAVDSYETKITSYVDFSKNLVTLIDNSINIISDNNLFCNLSEVLLPLYIKCSSKECYSEMTGNNKGDNTYNSSTNKILGISSRTNTFITIMRNELIYFKSILSSNMDKIGFAYKDNINNYIEKNMKNFKDDLNEINNLSNSNIFLLNSLRNNSVLQNYIREGFVNQMDTENLYIRTNMFRKTCGNPCGSIVDATNETPEQIQDKIKIAIENYNCTDCAGILLNPNESDSKIEPLITNIKDAITAFNTTSASLVENINSIRIELTPYIEDLKNLIKQFKEQVSSCSNTLNVLSSNELVELDSINSLNQLKEWNLKQVNSNLPQLNYTTYNSSRNVNTNISSLVSKIQSNYTKLESFMSKIEMDMFIIFMVFFEKQIEKIDTYINSVDCGLNNLLAYAQQNESDSNFSLLDSFSENLLTPKMFTIFNKGPKDTNNNFGGLDLGLIIDGLIG